MAKNIFTKLDEKHICYAVCVAQTSITFRRLGEFTSQDYFIICKSNYRKHYLMEKLNFKVGSLDEKGERDADLYPEKLLNYTLSESEINEFKENNDKYVKVIHNADGRIYELKNKSFLKKYNYDKRKT